jgi:hypothetical protein
MAETLTAGERLAVHDGAVVGASGLGAIMDLTKEPAPAAW